MQPGFALSVAKPFAVRTRISLTYLVLSAEFLVIISVTEFESLQNRAVVHGSDCGCLAKNKGLNR